jgi:hypothetical protein
MINVLYRNLFPLLLKKHLTRNFGYFAEGQVMTVEQKSRLIDLNSRFYTEKMMGELDRGFLELKQTQPFINTLSWLFLTCALFCVGAIVILPHNNGSLMVAMGSGGLAFGILIYVLARGFRILNSRIHDPDMTPASSIATQIPLYLIQCFIGISLVLVGALTHNVSSIISAVAILTMGVVTQYTAVSNFLMMFQGQRLSYEGIREFMNATKGLYPSRAKAWLMEESMDGRHFTIRSLQMMQGFDAEADDRSES